MGVPLFSSRGPGAYNTPVTTRLHFLGMTRIERAGETLALPAKTNALLAFLAVSADPQPRDRILGLLWGDSTQDAARKNLRNALWAIRKTLGEDAISAHGDRLALNNAIWADVRILEQTASAAPPPAALLDLYQGPFLDGLNLADAPEFELWTLSERERLAQTHLRLVMAALAGAETAERWPAVIALAQQALKHDNLQEPLYRALMQAHARLGERAEALRQYDILRTVLDHELGVAPLPETETLRTAIVGGLFDANARRAPRPPAPLTEARPVTPAPTALPFVGRDDERVALDDELARAAAGEVRVAALIGELGIGKSRLWQEWLATLSDDCTPLAARCLEATQGLPFAPLIELFSGHVCIRRLLTPASPVPGDWLAEAARLLPALRTSIPDLPAPPALPLAEERHRIFEAFVQLLLAAGRPLILFLDDAHWADHATLDWLAYLTHRLRAHPLLLILAYRPDEAPAALAHRIAAWGREGILRRLPLAHLTPHESAALIGALHVDPRAAHWVQFQSAGNPYFLIELGRASQDEPALAVPVGLADLVRARLARLPATAQQVLQAAAVLEPDCDAATLRRVSGRSEEEMLDALDALLAAGILIERAQQQMAFAHPLAAAVVRTELSGPRRAFLHRRAAAALENLHASRLAPIADRLLDHHRQAGDLGAAAQAADLAAQHALSLTALDEALNFLLQALALAPTPARQLALAAALAQSGDLPAARGAFEKALATALTAQDRQTATRACLGLAETYLPAGQPDQVIHWAMRSLEYLDPARDPAGQATAAFLLGAGRLRAGGAALDEAEARLHEAHRLAQAHGVSAIALLSRFELGNLLAERGDLPGAIALYDEVTAAAAAVRDPYRQALGLNNAAYHALLLGDLPAAQRRLQTAFTLTTAHDLRIVPQYLFSTRGELALAEGAWDEAESWFERSLAEAQRHGNQEHSAKCRANLALAARGRGDLDSAVVLLAQASALAAPLTTRFLQVQIALWQTEVYLARHERAAAAQALARAELELTDGGYARLQAQAIACRAALRR